MLAYLRQINPTRLVIFLIIVIGCFRLWYATRIGLVADEAYYWLWAQHPALSYRDKGPFVAWLIWLGTKMFGNTVFGIRFFAVVLSAGVGWLIFSIAKKLYDERTALWCVLMALVVPEMAVGSILMTIDTPSVFFWALAVLLFWNALHNNRISTWFWLGLAVGAGFLAKFTNGVQLICIGFFLLWSKEHRRLLFSPKIFVMCAAFLLASLPIFIWNIQTGWVHLMALHSRSGVTNTFHVSPGPFFTFVGLQFVVVSPLFMIGIVAAVIGLLLKNRGDLKIQFLLSQFLPLYCLFAFFALNNAGQPNWTVPVFVTGIIFTVVFWHHLVQRKPQWRYGVIAAFILAAIMTVGLHDTDFLPPQMDPAGRAKGWPDFADHIQKARAKYNADLLLGCDYQSASLMAFYLPDQPTVYMAPADYGSSQFTLWPGYQMTPNSRALYIAWDVQKKFPPTLQQQFPKIELVDNFMAQYHGTPRKHVCIYLCTQ